MASRRLVSPLSLFFPVPCFAFMAAYNPNKQGWGFAAVVVVITAGLFFTAHTIHARTYLHPRNPMMEQVYHDRDLAKEHEAAAGEHAAPAGEHNAAAPQGDQLPPKKEEAKPAEPVKK